MVQAKENKLVDTNDCSNFTGVQLSTWENSVNIDKLQMKFGGKSYDTQLINVSEKTEQKCEIYFHKIAVGLMFSQTEKMPRYSQIQGKRR